MTEIPDSLRSVFSASIDSDDGEHTVSIPAHEIENGGIVPGDTYRIAILDQPKKSTRTSVRQPDSISSPGVTPPVDPDEIIDVTIESIGDEGDGIAKVERGYVIIVPDGQPGDTLTVRINEVKENVAFAEIHH